MPGDIQKRKLLIVSDSAMYVQGKEVHAYEPVMRELVVLAPMFDEVIWLGSRVNKLSPILTADKPQNLRLVAMPSVRHTSFNLLKVLAVYPVFVFTILRYLLGATHVHTRGPSHPAFIVLLFSRLFGRKQYWHKYAGDWTSATAPFMYRLQRNLLRGLNNDNARVTVNGRGAGYDKHILSFENPCLYEAERDNAIRANKDFSDKLNILFVGEFTEAKGIDVLMQVIEDGLPERIGNIYLVGMGPMHEAIKSKCAHLERVYLAGAIHRAELDDYYRKAHLLILPSRSEGFPKVVAESAAYGCIPVVTGISVISTYVKDGVSGILMPDNAPATVHMALQRLCAMEEADLGNMSAAARQMTAPFTYEHYLHRIKNEIFTA